MKQIEQLQEILCTVESVEKDVKELRFGCKLKMWEDWEVDYWLFTHKEQVDEFSWFIHQTNDDWSLFCWEEWQDYKIIWNPLTLKHLMMYCNEKGIDIDYNSSWALWKDNWTNKPIATLDITKDYLYEQEDKVLLDIINFLKGV